MRPVGRLEVEAGIHRHDRQALHRQPEVAPDHRGEAVGLALERHDGALDLLVVLELDLVEPDELDGDAGGAGDADDAVLVGREDLLHVAVGDDVAHGRAAVAGHDDAAVEEQRHDRRAVRRLDARPGRQAPAGRQQLGAVGGDELGERRGAGREEGVVEPAAIVPWTAGSLAALLHEAADELLGVGLQDAVDLVEDAVDVVGGPP